MKAVSIGKVKVDIPVILAPMAGVTDYSYRQICRQMGAGMTCTEMISAKGIYYGNRGTAFLIATAPDEHPVSVQLFGSDPDIVAQIAMRIEQLPFDILDINMGCPVPKIVNNGEGSALMKRPLLAAEIITRTVRAIKKPVTVKMRSRFSDDEGVDAVELAHIAKESGASAVCIHGRTRAQFYSGRADWDIIRRAKERVDIPVIANGDISSPESALAVIRHTGCDGIMVGRAARGNPWIFGQIRAAIEGDKIPPKPDIDEVRRMIMHHGKLISEDKGEYTGMHQMRKHVAWYTAGYPHSVNIRRRVNEIDTLDDLYNLLYDCC